MEYFTDMKKWSELNLSREVNCNRQTFYDEFKSITRLHTILWQKWYNQKQIKRVVGNLYYIRPSRRSASERELSIHDKLHVMIK